MTKVIALSGIGNTGKSTIIHGHYEDGRLAKQGLVHLFIQKGKSYKLYGEVAREVMKVVDPSMDMALFQKNIFAKEVDRVNQIRREVEEGLIDIIVCDRTWLDNMVYAYYNVLKGRIDEPMQIVDLGDIYDEVFLLERPIKKTGTEEFKHYDNGDLARLMHAAITTRFPGYRGYRNGVIDGQQIINFVENRLL